jgi:adenosylhomocysteine nucleosidase
MAVHLTGDVAVLYALPAEVAGIRRVRPHWQFIHVGVGGVTAGTAARRYLESHRPDVVLSLGICGGLAPDLRIGDLVVPTEVCDSTGICRSCVTLDGLTQPHAQSLQKTPVRLFSASRVVLNAADKARLARETRANVVDLEAAAVANVCAEFGVPFAAVKAVSDAASDSLPVELPWFAPQGEPQFGRLAFAVLRRPSLIPELVRLGRNCRTACRALTAAVTERLPTPRSGPPVRNLSAR